MKRDTNDYFNFRSTNGGHYLLTRLPVWATAGIMIGILMTVLVGRSLTEGLMYNIAYSSMVGDAALMTGPGFRVTWKRTRDTTVTDWKAVAADLLAPMPEPDRAAVVGPRTVVKEGFRPFRISLGKGDTEY